MPEPLALHPQPEGSKKVTRACYDAFLIRLRPSSRAGQGVTGYLTQSWEMSGPTPPRCWRFPRRSDVTSRRLWLPRVRNAASSVSLRSTSLQSLSAALGSVVLNSDAVLAKL